LIAKSFLRTEVERALEAGEVGEFSKTVSCYQSHFVVVDETRETVRLLPGDIVAMSEGKTMFSPTSRSVWYFVSTTETDPVKS
jgi:hypothetical protein